MDSIALIATEGSGEVEKFAKMRNKPRPQISTPAASLFKLASEAPKLQNLQALTTEEKNSNEILTRLKEHNRRTEKTKTVVVSVGRLYNWANWNLAFMVAPTFNLGS
jgi:hypothetical protein